jgi:hypothetical protein
MADPLSPRFVIDLLHEVAEGLQSAGAYLGAARPISGYNASEHASIAEIIDKAAGGITRAQTAFHQLREHLLSERRHESDMADTAGPANAVPPLREGRDV